MYVNFKDVTNPTFLQFYYRGFLALWIFADVVTKCMMHSFKWHLIKKSMLGVALEIYYWSHIDWKMWLVSTRVQPFSRLTSIAAAGKVKTYPSTLLPALQYWSYEDENIVDDQLTTKAMKMIYHKNYILWKKLFYGLGQMFKLFG